jgi:hypothetical protein
MTNRQPPSTQVQAIKDRPNSPGAIRLLRWTLLILVMELTFEGLARKLDIHGTSIAIFLLKDVIVAGLWVQIFRLRRPPALDFLWVAFWIEAVLFLPLIIATAAHDPILAVFGAKEYLLYPVVAFAVFIGFENASTKEIVTFFRWAALLVIPTAALALVQLRLPPTHWLNLAVNGDMLDGFSAGGHLRVSSTFSFVAQYCSFINAEVFITMIALNNLKGVNWFLKCLYLSIVPLLVLSSYVTGSRGAVLVNCVIIGIAAVLCLITFQTRSAFRIAMIIGGLLIVLGISHYVFPDAFAAYSEREEGQLIGASSEVQDRIYNATFGWMKDAFSTPILGNGLGVMSNGSELLSNYATTTRAFSWTETDFATTLFEGGLYLVFVWYGFRYFVIYQALRRFLAAPGSNLSVPSAFCVGFVIVEGFSGTLGIQPPMAIWWWLSVGTALLFWWKALEPTDAPKTDDAPQPPVPTEISRGRSAYSDRLQSRK